MRAPRHAPPRYPSIDKSGASHNAKSHQLAPVRANSAAVTAATTSPSKRRISKIDEPFAGDVPTCSETAEAVVMLHSMIRDQDSTQLIRGCRVTPNEKGRARGSPFSCSLGGGNYFFGGAITSLADFATRNLTTVLALILMASPVWGLRPMRALRSALTKRPIPGITNTPLFLVSLMAVSANRSRKAADCLLVSSSFSARSRVRAVLVSPDAIECSPSRRALRAACLVGLPPKILTAWRNAIESCLARNPCIHAATKNPADGYHAA